MDMNLIFDYTKELIGTGILLIVLISLRLITTKLVKRYAKSSHTLEHRTNLVIKYIHLFTNILAFISLVLIWGVQTKDIFIALSSITTVVGVAMFAQWSILSNITAGVILFFSFPFKIGDVIKFAKPIKWKYVGFLDTFVWNGKNVFSLPNGSYDRYKIPNWKMREFVVVDSK